MSDDAIFYSPPATLIHTGADLVWELFGEEPILVGSDLGMDQRRRVGEAIDREWKRTRTFGAHVTDLRSRCRRIMDTETTRGSHSRWWYAKTVLDAIRATERAIAAGDAPKAASEAGVVFAVAMAAEIRFSSGNEGRDAQKAKQARLRDEVLTLRSEGAGRFDSDNAAAHELLEQHRLHLDEWEHTPRTEKGEVPDRTDEHQMSNAAEALRSKIGRAFRRRK